MYSSSSVFNMFNVKPVSRHNDGIKSIFVRVLMLNLFALCVFESCFTADNLFLHHFSRRVCVLLWCNIWVINARWRSMKDKPVPGFRFNVLIRRANHHKLCICQGWPTCGSRATCGSLKDYLWLSINIPEFPFHFCVIF